jgi:hypothetical protein
MSNPIALIWPSVNQAEGFVAQSQDVEQGADLVLIGTPYPIIPNMSRTLLIEQTSNLGTQYMIKGADIYLNPISEILDIPGGDTTAYTIAYFHRVYSITLLSASDTGISVGLGATGYLMASPLDYNRPYWNATVQTFVAEAPAADTSQYTLFSNVLSLNNLEYHAEPDVAYLPSIIPGPQPWFETATSVLYPFPDATDVTTNLQIHVTSPRSTIGAHITFGTSLADNDFSLGMAILQQGI